MSARGRWRSEAQVYLLRDAPFVELAAPLEWEEPDGRVVSVPVGFRSDGATIPQWAWSLVGGRLDGRYRRAAILHDWQCVTQKEPPLVVHARFREAMLADAVAPLVAWAFWLVVRVAGPTWETQ
jgi:hypothetical protein